ncbi:substrate-binding domain-containing protein [Synoicihabitans lomoniglobus]|uniref:Substrate-binding domain-containing protein n=1 Tax=Synoicihabitans lomoniglobus TaxID=2909285 RepID=A0AAE9ZUE4_9BACT|nr:substrate-binding domain-containing protein [Opitutaceae bacterium LMO-M01]WED63249.1 substrate-binding domain-containing protein [Opitutaceae bacterium LMO-M01]
MLSIETEHWHGVLQGLAEGFRRSPQVQVIKIARPAKFEPVKLRRLQLDGLITRLASREDEVALLKLGVPVVNVSGRTEGKGLTNIINDDERVGELAARFFVRRGFERLGFCGVDRHRSSRLRGRGYRRAGKAAGATTEMLVLPEMPEGDAPSARAVARIATWLKPQQRPVGVFCFNDAVARAVAEACADIGANIPADVAVLGVDNDDIQLGFSSVALSSIELNRRRIGYEAARRLLAEIENPDLPVETVRVPPLKIVARGSTDKLAVNDEVVAAALDYIGDRLANTIYVEEVARSVGVSRRSLEMRFRAALQTSVYAEVQRQQLERAEVLLQENPKMTIAEVAYACGFQDARHLSIVCRRKLGRPPGSLRIGN